MTEDIYQTIRVWRAGKYQEVRGLIIAQSRTNKPSKKKKRHLAQHSIRVLLSIPASVPRPKLIKTSLLSLWWEEWAAYLNHM